MKSTLEKLVTPAISLILVMVGSALLTTLVSVRLEMEHYSAFVVGIITTAYYGGLMVGSFKTERFVTRVGHIRAYSTFAAILAVVTLLQGLYVDVEAWIFFRFVSGYCLAGLFIVIESWFLASGTNNYRGRLLALYMMALYVAQSAGQFLLQYGDPQSLKLFSLVTVLTCLSIIPLSSTYVKSPSLEEPSVLNFSKLYKASPTGIIGAFCSGLFIAAITGLLPVYIMRVGYTKADVGNIMGLLIFGGMALQYPIGKFSDHFDRRKILILICCFIFILSFGMVVASYLTKFVFILISILFGGLVYVLYPLSISHACDYIKVKDTVAAVQGLLLSYSIGATVGPTVASIFIYFFNPFGLFVFFMLVASFLGYFIYWRGQQRPSIDVEEQQVFEIGASTTPVASEMDPRIEEEHSKE